MTQRMVGNQVQTAARVPACVETSVGRAVVDAARGAGIVGMSLRSLLLVPVMGAASVLAGESGLERLVGRVMPLELPDAVGWLTGGELVFTTGCLLGDDSSRWINFLSGLDDAGASGVVVLASRFVQLIPDDALQVAAKRNFPVLVMADPVHMRTLLDPLEGAIAEGCSQSTRHVTDAHRSLLKLVSTGDGMEAITGYLSRQLGRSVFVEDRLFGLLALSTHDQVHEPYFDELLQHKGTPVQQVQAWESDGTLRRVRGDQRTAQVVVNGKTRTIHPVVMEGDVLGYFSVLSDGADEPLPEDLLEAGLFAVAIELLKLRGASDSDQRMRRDFFRDLLLASSPTHLEAIRRRANYLGYALDTAYWVMQIEFVDGADEEGVTHEDAARLMGLLSAQLSFRQALVVQQAQGATVLYPIKEGQPQFEKLQHLALAIRQKLLAAWPGRSFNIGVSEPSAGLLGIPRAFTAAGHALKIGQSLQGSCQVSFFKDLGIYRMLLLFSQNQDPQAFCCEPLQRLIDYNQQTDKELVKTIEAFLDCNGNLTETSAKLFIHRNTLKYRLERIRDITQIDLDDAQNRLMLHLGLKMNQVVNFLN
jgi:purine catabolism regulator